MTHPPNLHRESSIDIIARSIKDLALAGTHEMGQENQCVCLKRVIDLLVEHVTANGDVLPLKEYWRMLDDHDWLHGMSDDHRVFQAGAAQERGLKNTSMLSEEHLKLFAEFKDYYREHLCKPPHKKPARPE